MSILTKLKGYKTVIINAAVALGGVFYGQDVVDALNTIGLTTDQAIDALVAAWAAANIVLRAVTTSPIFKKL